MVGALRRIVKDLQRRRHVDAYMVSAATLVLAVLSLIGDAVSDDVRWGVLLAALGLLVYQITVPDTVGSYDDLLNDRTAFDDTTFMSQLNGASRVWVFAPAAVNLLTDSAADDLRRTVLANPDGLVRIAVLDPSSEDAIQLASRQLDDATDFPIQNLSDGLSTTAARLRSMAQWSTRGLFEYRYVGYNPGFSLVAIDPHAKHGVIIVEFHGFHNESTRSRMHIQLRRRDSEHWFAYWIDQFESLWDSARMPDATGS